MCLQIFIILYCLQFILINGQTTQTIRVLYVNVEDNSVADKSLEVAINYVMKNNKLGIRVEVQKVFANLSDSSGLLDSLCHVYSNSLEAKTPPHIVLDMTTSGEAADTVKSFTKALSLPTISTSFGQKDDILPWRNLDTQQKSFLVQVQPPADVIPEIIRVLVLQQNITNAAIFYDKNFEMRHKYKTLLQNVPTRHILIPIMKLTEIRNKLTKLEKLNLVNFFVLGSLNTIKNILDTADSLGLFSQKYSWYAITLEKGTIKCACKRASILYINPVISVKSQDRLGLIRMSYRLTMKPEILAAFYFDIILNTFMTLRDMIADGLWNRNISYISCDEFDKNNSPERKILNLKKYFAKDKGETPVYSPFSITQNGDSQMNFNMQLFLISIQDGSSDKSINTGLWNTKRNSKIDIYNSNVMSNFTAKLIYRIVTVVQQPFVIEDDESPKGYKGFCIDLIEEISKILHFDYEIIPVADGKFGVMNENGVWNGLVRELLERRADIGLGSMSVTAERENVIDFTIPFYDLVGATILMKMNKGSSSLFKFLTVLESDVWFCILAAYFVTSTILWIFDRWSPYSYQNNREKYKNDEERREFTFKECLWFCMTSLTPQGGGEAPKNLSGRLVAATWWLFGFIIIASYTANLAAFLTVSRLDSSVETFDDLAKQYKILYAPLNGSSVMNYFQRMADIESKFYEIWKDMSLNDSLSDIERAKLAVWDYPVSDKYSKMWQVMQEAGLPQTLNEAIDRVKESKSASEGFAFLGDATDIRYSVLTNCDLQMVGEEFSKKPYAIAVQQGSPLREQLNKAILQLINRRYLETLKEKWWTNNENAKVCEQLDDQSEGISIRNIGGVFIVIFTGIGIACIVLIFEYWWYKYRKVNLIRDTHKKSKEKIRHIKHTRNDSLSGEENSISKF